jgi:hypothetical protein
MNQENLLQLASDQALLQAEWIRNECSDSAADEIRFVTFARPSGVIDLFVVEDGGGFVSDTLFPVGYVTLRGDWVETFGCSDGLPFEYFDGPAVEVGAGFVFPAVV